MQGFSNFIVGAKQPVCLVSAILSLKGEGKRALRLHLKVNMLVKTTSFFLNNKAADQPAMFH